MLAANRRLDAWLRIDPVGTVTVYTGRVELGQGNLTALAQIVAEELDIAFERVRMIPVDTMRSPNEGTTAGSNSIEAGGAALRAAAAEARAIRAQARGRAAVGAGRYADRQRRHRHCEGCAGADQLLGDSRAKSRCARMRREASQPKPASAHKIVGTPAQRIDIPGKVHRRADVRAGHAPSRHGVRTRGEAALRHMRSLFRSTRRRSPRCPA